MSWSLKYNNIDLSTYGLRALTNSPAIASLMNADQSQLADRTYAAESLLPGKSLVFDIIVQAASTATLKSYLDSIKRVCGQREAKQLIPDAFDDRYWTARFQSLNGEIISPYAYEGQLTFMADDPLAYAVTGTSSDFNIDADPKTVTETPGGTAYMKPVYTLTAGEVLAAITLLVENTDTGEELQWEGSVGNGKALVIDAGLWIVTNDGSADMAGLSGQFPRLIPGADNHIKITDFSNTGTLNIAYRDAYL